MRFTCPEIPAMTTSLPIRIGTAGWSIPTFCAEEFPAAGSHLERYAARFNAVEINSSFYRPHRNQTYARWAGAVPEDFRFAMKMPKAITHELRLQDVGERLEQFLGEVSGLGNKLGPLLVQLPPSLAFEPGIAESFFALVRQMFGGNIVCEPRHASWFTPVAEALLVSSRVGRVAADPAKVPGADAPGGWSGLTYWRLHGSPRIYYSAYESDYLETVAGILAKGALGGAEAWCIFDNTASGAATGNALELVTRLAAPLQTTGK